MLQSILEGSFYLDKLLIEDIFRSATEFNTAHNCEDFNTIIYNSVLAISKDYTQQ